MSQVANLEPINLGCLKYDIMKNGLPVENFNCSMFTTQDADVCFT